MNHYFITGTSRGIGKAMAEQLLRDANNFVTGLSRTSGIQHERYTHVEIDLSDLEKVKQFNFPVLEQAKKIALVNNAGAIGEVHHVGKLKDDGIVGAYNVNLVAPTLLTNSFLSSYASNPAKQVIINISSGAGKNPIDGWSVYCATKAGLDMFTKVVAEELKLSDKKNVFVFAVAPGVVDTSMQEQIRSALASDFSQLQRFIDYKKSDQLEQPGLVAGKYLSILETPEIYTDVVFSVKNI